MKPYFAIALSISVLCVAVSCVRLSSSDTADGEGKRMGYSYRLTPSQVRRLEFKARGGDVDSALMLARYWDIWMRDVAQGAKWHLRAAELGDPVAQWNYASRMLGSVTATEKEKNLAIALMKKSAAAGVPEAVEYLKNPNLKR